MTSTTLQHLLSVLSLTVLTRSTTANKTLFLSEDAEITGFILTKPDGTKHFVDSGAVITLDAEDRALLTLLHIEEMPLAETAAHFGWSRVKAKVKAFRARQRLKSILTQHGYSLTAKR